eukprot:TRINITY_DN16356_c0_g1_i1.p1 TRINITY_DN16356_c0_g1~~TRINITY_DN16356_c0_g1_i1.p1  ORF type:complete len:575 (-),score=61.87 TRINITY_DN16356_c0_g1_i1:128-1747(-)
MSVKESSLKLWHACKADSLRVLYHPFHLQLARGKIPQISFKKYIQQDFVCLEKSIQIYDNAVQKLSPPQLQLQQDLSQVLQQQKLQLSLRKNYFNFLEENEKQNQVENNSNYYLQYLNELDTNDSIIPIITSILPYQKLNAFVWSQIMQKYSEQNDSDFLRWLSSFDLNQYNNTIQSMEQILDELLQWSDLKFDQSADVYQKVIQLYTQQINSYNCNNQQKRIGFMAVDFDETLSTQETISVLIDAIKFAKIESAVENKDVVEHKFQEEVNRLVKGYISASSELVSSLNLTHQIQNSNGARPLNSKRLNEIISRYTEFEQKMNQVVIDASVLSGVSSEQIQKQSQNIELQPDCIEVLGKYLDQKISTIIISVNWSAILICSALSKLNMRPFVGYDYQTIDVQNKGIINVFSNELEFDEQSGLSTGGIVRRIECSEDKGNLFQILNKIYNEDDQYGTVFVGDSFGDIMGMLSADFGIVIGKNKQLRQVCGDVGIQIVPLLTADFGKNEEVLYCVDGWEEIDAFLSWRVVENFTDVQQAVC